MKEGIEEVGTPKNASESSRKPVVLVNGHLGRRLGRLERCALDAAGGVNLICADQINATVSGDIYSSRVARAERGGGYAKAILYVDLTTGLERNIARGTSK